MSRRYPSLDEQERINSLRELLAVAKARGDAHRPETAKAIKQAERDLREYERELESGDDDE